MIQQKSGQGTTEYLIILAVVIIIALIVVSVLGWFPGFGGAITEQQSQAYWQSQSPLAIVQWNIDTSNTKLVLRNMTTTNIMVTEISMSGTNLGLTDTNIAGGGEESFTSSSIACASTDSRKQYAYDITITYTSPGIANASQAGQKPLVGICP